MISIGPPISPRLFSYKFLLGGSSSGRSYSAYRTSKYFSHSYHISSSYPSGGSYKLFNGYRNQKESSQPKLQTGKSTSGPVIYLSRRSLHQLTGFSQQPMLSYFTNWIFRRRNAPVDIRSYSTNNQTIPQTVVESFHPRLRSIFLQLDAISPRFVVPAKNIHVLTTPAEFYSTLKTKIKSARQRIFLSSLYIGKSQYELISCIDEALTANPDLSVSVLTDALRGTREAPENRCSASLLVPLVEKHGKHRVDVRMYHTPHLAGLTKSMAPRRINESWGLQHMKLYGFDDEIMLSGANLSEDYFTNRQDRYYIFSDGPLTDYYQSIQSAVSSLSYQLVPSTKNPQGFRLTWPTANKSCEPSMNLHRFISDSSYLLEPILKQHQVEPIDLADSEIDTVVYPVSQFTPLLHPQNDLSTEKPAILRLLSYLDSPKIRWWFTAGYFNMHPQIQERLISGKASGVVVTAAPQANSFYKSAGVSYYLPEAYLLCAKHFLEEVARRGQASLISLYEWSNGVVNTPDGWSYHAKGLWITVPDEDEPSVTVIGSSNYTKRAYSLDLESNAVIVTKDPVLKKTMRSEVDNLMNHVERLTLKDFEPKPVIEEPENDSEGLSPSKTNATTDEDRQLKQTYAIDENRRISYGVHLALKLLGGKM
ncbi:CDP-diacylglycerol--glycerol-3-phosphate 3-phosphatidyltransferase [[Candida] anglica]|uniref:CDP-diacylglycerol--glycerol-3-phosphate 3-phosphatidyltransferase n=1 Tax=[Candida] anglica TaxID=148631 RepID=A0ABP0EKH2_9ASCO